MWDEVFGQEEYVYGTEPNDFIRETIKEKSSGKVACLAEGEGRNAVYLASLGYDVTAFDSSAAGLAKCEKLAGTRGVNVTTVHADLATYNIKEDSWDGVAMVFGHFPPSVRKTVIESAVKGLRKGGFFVMEGYSKEQLQYGTGGPPVAEMLYSLEELHDDFAGRLDLKIAHKIVRLVREGGKHNGEASVIQIYGLKI